MVEMIKAGTSIEFFMASMFSCLIPLLDLHDDDNNITVVIADNNYNSSSKLFILGRISLFYWCAWNTCFVKILM